MELVRIFHKNLGETPLECLHRFKAENPEYASLPATYAGRLDPAAEGELLFLFGSEVYKKDDYLAYDKTYEATFALGVSTDTGDLLGLPKNVFSDDHLQTLANLDEEKIKKVSNELCREIKKTHEQRYPAFSSKTVNGKPLFVHTREGSDVPRPMRNVAVRECSLVDVQKVAFSIVVSRACQVADLVQGDFRQNEIVQHWKELEASPVKNENQTGSATFLITLRLTVSSGTYIRAFIETFEKVFGVPAVLYSLVRTKIHTL